MGRATGVFDKIADSTTEGREVLTRFHYSAYDEDSQFSIRTCDCCRYRYAISYYHHSVLLTLLQHMARLPGAIAIEKPQYAMRDGLVPMASRSALLYPSRELRLSIQSCKSCHLSKMDG
jgi:hypothetical protein